MSYIRSTIFALAASCSLAGPALAQGGGSDLRDLSVMFVMPDGRMMMRTMTDRAMVDALVQRGKPLAAGQALVMRGGKVYIVDDYKMADGKMLSEILMSTN